MYYFIFQMYFVFDRFPWFCQLLFVLLGLNLYLHSYIKDSDLTPPPSSLHAKFFETFDDIMDYRLLSPIFWNCMLFLNCWTIRPCGSLQIGELYPLLACE